MRRILATLILLGALGAASASEADPLVGLRFSDGRARSLADFPGQSVMVVFFCGHCPTAAAHLGKPIKELHDFIEKEKVPVTLVLATPDFPAPEALALNKARDYHMDNALWASDPGNQRNISLQNVMQDEVYGPDHRPARGFAWNTEVKAFETFFASKEAGQFRYPVTGLGDARVKEVWWAVERQRPEAVKALVAAAKTKSPAQPELQQVLTTVKEALATREAALVAAPASMETYESLEALLGEGQGIELKDATARYKELGKAKELKDEIAARAAYRACAEALASPKPDLQAGGKAGLAQLARKYPETVYGRRAANGK
jgi:hypothetical protein